VKARAPEQPEDSIALRAAVLAALMAAAIAVLREGVGRSSLWPVVLVGYPLAFTVAHLTRRSRPLLLRAAVSAIAIVVVVLFAASITVGTIAAVQVPLAEVFMVLLGLQALEASGRRGLMVSLLAALVLVTLAGVFSISTALAPWLAGWAFATLLALALAHRSELERLPRLDGAASRPSAGIRTALGIAAAVFAVVTLLGAAAFAVAPVAGTDRSFTFPAELPPSEAVPEPGGLSNPSLGGADPARRAAPGEPGGRRSAFGYFGFSDELDTGVRGRPDDTLVMRVRAASPDFWRGQTFDRWDGRTWRASDDHPRPVRGGQPIGIPRVLDDGPANDFAAVDQLVQTYYLEQAGPNVIFAAATPTRLYFPERTIFQMPDGALRAGVRLDPESVYTVVSQRNLVTETALRVSDATQVAPEIAAKYAAPPETTARVRALAASVAAGAPTTYDKVRALETWIGAHTRYTLDIPPLPRGHDAVDQFLFVDRRGFCEQIGTSLVVMLRELGIPARLVVGYTPGERNPFTGLYEVRARDAHAWAEVYFPGVGWQGFDPTASVPLAGDAAIDGAGTGALAYLNARIDLPAWLGPVLALLAVFVVLSFAARSWTRRTRRVRAARPTSWAGVRLERLERLGRRRGRDRAAAETTPHYAAALGALDPIHAPALAAAARVLDASMFSGRAVDEAAASAVDGLLELLDQNWDRARHPEDLVPTPS